MTNTVNTTEPGTFKDRLQQASIVVAPGVYDALSASLAEQAGFDTVYLSGASLAYTKLASRETASRALPEANAPLPPTRDPGKIPIVETGDTAFAKAVNVMKSCVC